MTDLHKQNLGDLTREGLNTALRILGAKHSAAASVFLRYYKNRMSELEGLPASLWEKVIAKYPLPAEPTVSKQVSAKDGTKKLLLTFEDGAPAECVILNGKNNRRTACLSSQSGCMCGCKFCATGKWGFKRNLYPSEIVAQFKHCLAEADGVLDSIVFMGMGEPFLNWDNVKKAILILSDPKSFAFSQGKITVSTVGIIPVIEELITSDLKIKLAFSVITSDEKKRELITPMQAKYPMSDVLFSLRKYCEAKDTQILAEYILFDGNNDTEEDAMKLIKLLEGMKCRINLIPFNSSRVSDADKAEKAKAFQKILIDAGFRTYLRLEKGSDIMAACGQLAADLKK